MSGFDDNPFADSSNVNPFQAGLSGPTIPASKNPSQPAVLQPSTDPSPKEELERKAADLDRREQELQSRGASTGKENNWPPLPKVFPIKPCFYQDFSEEIPLEYQRVCKMIYYLWMSDSSFNFFFFFFAFFCQVVLFVIQSVGIPKWGNSGWIASFTIIGTNKAVGAIMIVVACFFTTCAVLSIILLKMVHSMYRRTGASFQKAQQEFSQGVLTNKSFQTAATSAASSAASGAFQGNN
ncbi:unnamed protein product [Coregonus sp. 'balchen']|nr:unnamed protein product [Coregonus sp. 'balchen']